MTVRQKLTDFAARPTTWLIQPSFPGVGKIAIAPEFTPVDEQIISDFEIAQGWAPDVRARASARRAQLREIVVTPTSLHVGSTVPRRGHLDDVALQRMCTPEFSERAWNLLGLTADWESRFEGLMRNLDPLIQNIDAAGLATFAPSLNAFASHVCGRPTTVFGIGVNRNTEGSGTTLSASSNMFSAYAAPNETGTTMAEGQNWGFIRVIYARASALPSAPAAGYITNGGQEGRVFYLVVPRGDLPSRVKGVSLGPFVDATGTVESHGLRDPKRALRLSTVVADADQLRFFARPGSSVAFKTLTTSSGRVSSPRQTIADYNLGLISSANECIRDNSNNASIVTLPTIVTSPFDGLPLLTTGLSARERQHWGGAHFRAAVIGGPEFVEGYTLFGPVTIDVASRRIDIGPGKLHLDWLGSRLVDLGGDTSSVTEAELAEARALRVRSVCYGTEYTVPSDPVRLTKAYSQAGGDLLGEELFPARGTEMPALTFQAASRRAQGVKYSILHGTARLQPDADSRVRVTFGGATLETATWSIEGQSTTDLVDLYNALRAGAAIRVIAPQTASIEAICQQLLGIGYGDIRMDVQETVPSESEFDETALFGPYGSDPHDVPTARRAGYYLVAFGRPRNALSTFVASAVVQGAMAGNKLLP